MKKTVSGIMLTLLLIGMLTLAFVIQPVKASGTIYIRADGSVEPSTANITSVDNVTYTFTGNIYDEIVLERDDIVVDGAGYTVQGTEPYPPSKGIDLSHRNNVTIKNVQIKAFYYGIMLYYSSNNTISGNSITKNERGIYLSYSSGNNISGNGVSLSTSGVVVDHYSSSNTVSGNNITLSVGGIGEGGIVLAVCWNNSIVGNTITKSSDGFYLLCAWNNTLFGNNATENSCGVHLWEASDNKFYHNSFVSNIQQAYAEVPYYANFWDDGYPSGGNYWSDYVGVDVKSGSNQNLPGSDGIGDSQYVIDENNIDHYPLMSPYGVPPPPTYALTITTTVGGTTSPALGTYSYTANSAVQVTAISNANYLFNHWELDSVNVSANPYSVIMDKDHTLKSVFSRIPGVPVGGYSFPIQVQTKAEPIIPYIALIATLTAIFIPIKRRAKRKH